MQMAHWGGDGATEALVKAARRAELETYNSQESLPEEREKRLYVGTGFPQLVQGKRGENWGASKISGNIFVLGLLGSSGLETLGTRTLVYDRTCVLCTIAACVKKV